MAQREIRSLTKKIRGFASKRDWDKFHSPKNLAFGLVIEAGELAEHFLWEDRPELSKKKLRHIAEEIGDVLIYLLNLSSRIGVDPVQAAEKKLTLNARKYPVRAVHGSSKKYTEY